MLEYKVNIRAAFLVNQRRRKRVSKHRTTTSRHFYALYLSFADHLKIEARTRKMTGAIGSADCTLANSDLSSLSFWPRDLSTTAKVSDVSVVLTRSTPHTHTPPHTLSLDVYVRTCISEVEQMTEPPLLKQLH